MRDQMPYFGSNPTTILAHCRALQENATVYAPAGDPRADGEIATGAARAIAGLWHGGQGSAFYAFSSSGHYDRDALLAELSDVIAHSYNSAPADDRLMLDMLGTYLINRS
jgi:hypothetical protein